MIFNDDLDFVIRYSIIELYEKIIRIKKFIRTAYEQDKRESNKQLFKLYDQTLSFISNQLNEFCRHLPKSQNEGVIFDNMIYIAQNYRAVITVHQDLKNVSTIKILPEINSFLNEIDSQEEKIKKFNIILTDNYSFKERNLGKKILRDLNNIYQKEPNIDNTHTFILPKIEFSNPLNWSILVHEYGHLVSDNESDSFIQKLKANGIILNPSEEQNIRNWVEEMFCDAFAAKSLGPSYLVSFLSFNLLNSFDCSRHSYSHPSVYLRAENIKSFLHRNNADFSTSRSLKNYGKLFNDTMLRIDTSCNRYIGTTTLFKLNVNQTNILRTFREYISEKEKMVIIPSNSNNNLEIVELLNSKLKKGLPIGTIRKKIEPEKLREYEERLKDLNEEQIKEWKQASIERPTTHWEILNAGWIYKIEHIKDIASDLFFSSYEKGIEDKLEEYSQHIDKLDDILLHSISSSQIINSIEK